MAAPAGMPVLDGYLMPTGSSSRYALHPCITRHPPAPAITIPLCIPASPFSHFLGRMVWGSGALGELRAPPMPAWRPPRLGWAAGGRGLPAALLVCSGCPVHRWAGSGLAIRCQWLQLVGVGLVDHIEACAVLP